MKYQNIPSGDQLRALLEGLDHAQMQRLALVSGVPFTTLWKVRDGSTTNPRIETVRTFLNHAVKLAKEQAKVEAA